MLKEVKIEEIINEFKQGDSFVVEEIETGVIQVYDNYYGIDEDMILWRDDEPYNHRVCLGDITHIYKQIEG